MIRRPIAALLLLGFLGAPALASDTTRPENDEMDQTSSAQESESPSIIPAGGITVSTQPVTPISLVPERNLYDQAREELALAQALWAKGRAEAASDVALQAYDDLLTVRISRKTKKMRKEIRAERHTAATVYIDSSLAYIQEYRNRVGDGPKAMEECRARLGDLRDVAMNYPELGKKLTKALEPYAVKPPSPPVVAVSTPSVVAASTPSVVAVSVPSVVAVSTPSAVAITTPTAHH